MLVEKQEALFNKYPALFKDKDKHMSETCMCWGISCGDGWYDILDKFCEAISQYDVIFMGVKEKYGGLRISTRGVPTEFLEIINETINKLEEESYETCEFCGTKENVWVDKVGWVSTACQSCREKDSRLQTYNYTDEEIDEIEKHTVEQILEFRKNA